MRIISGKAKGHQIYAPKGFNTRPTSDRVRESLFNIIQPIIYDTNVLDLFAGTGALGIEALSRGAKHADFVEYWLPAVKIIRKNLNLTKLENQATVFYEDSIGFLKKSNSQYDLVFVDPPYNTDLALQALNSLQERLKLDGTIIVETGHIIEMPGTVGELSVQRKKTYGDTAIWFYKYA
ncbi:MAG: 16S rRNA (guanine(966)-N(2))-methyltransferase RsmD [Zhaonellaceae bacterium]|jgi:16S rRNA (guanine966-N2)-methyltransferase